MRLEEIKTFLEEQADSPAEYDEQLVPQLVEKVIAYDERLTVEFKSAIMMDVKNRKMGLQGPVVWKQATGFYAFRESMVWPYCVINCMAYNLNNI